MPTQAKLKDKEWKHKRGEEHLQKVYVAENTLEDQEIHVWNSAKKEHKTSEIPQELSL